jgi:MYXO-CTERM domain-containing protein
MFRKFILPVAVALGISASAASAAPVLSSHVDSSVFSATIGDTSGWAYLGQSTSAFTADGVATLVMRDSSFNDSFGISQLDYSGTVPVFSPGAAVGSTSNVTGYDPSYLFFFRSVGAIGVFDNNMQFTDGHGSGGLPGSFQGDIDIFHNDATDKWAFFYDDGGESGLGDDNDYNDLVVTFSQAAGAPPVQVLEPRSIGILGLALLALAFLRRRASA